MTMMTARRTTSVNLSCVVSVVFPGVSVKAPRTEELRAADCRSGGVSRSVAVGRWTVPIPSCRKSEIPANVARGHDAGHTSASAGSLNHRLVQLKMSHLSSTRCSAYLTRRRGLLRQGTTLSVQLARSALGARGPLSLGIGRPAHRVGGARCRLRQLTLARAMTRAADRRESGALGTGRRSSECRERGWRGPGPLRRLRSDVGSYRLISPAG